MRLQFLLDECSYHVAKLYSFKVLNTGNFWYICEKLKPLNETEKNVVSIILKKNIFKMQYKSATKIALNNFFRKLRKSGITHIDLHANNICKDKYGKYKLIDLEDIVFSD